MGIGGYPYHVRFLPQSPFNGFLLVKIINVAVDNFHIVAGLFERSRQTAYAD